MNVFCVHIFVCIYIYIFINVTNTHTLTQLDAEATKECLDVYEQMKRRDILVTRYVQARKSTLIKVYSTFADGTPIFAHQKTLYILHLNSCISSETPYIRKSIEVNPHQSLLYFCRRYHYIPAKEPYICTKEPYTSAACKRTSQPSPKSTHISAKEPYISRKEPYTSATCQHAIQPSSKSTILLRTVPMYFRKRALHIRKKALHICYEHAHTSSLIKVCSTSANRTLICPQKSPMYPQYSPVHLLCASVQVNPHQTEAPLYLYRRYAYISAKGSMCPQKSPIYP